MVEFEEVAGEVLGEVLGEVAEEVVGKVSGASQASPEGWICLEALAF